MAVALCAKSTPAARCPSVKRLTLDMTAIRDATDCRREHHPAGLELLGAAERGELELGIPPQGVLSDLAGSSGTELSRQITELQAMPGVVVLRQVARLSNVTYPSDTLFPGAYIDGLHEAWNTETGKWNGPGRCPGTFDRWYLETHLVNGRDTLVTDDRGLRTMCGLLGDGLGVDIDARSITEFVAGWV